MEHFGIKLIQRKHSFKLNREEFALISTKPSLPMFESLIKKKLIQMSQVASIEKIGVKNTESYVYRIMI